jgi:hypothetical protein
VPVGTPPIEKKLVKEVSRGKYERKIKSTRITTLKTTRHVWKTRNKWRNLRPPKGLSYIHLPLNLMQVGNEMAVNAGFEGRN